MTEVIKEIIISMEHLLSVAGLGCDNINIVTYCKSSNNK